MAEATLPLFLVASIALILTPGPDTVYVLTQGVGGGPRTGVRSALGISTGVLVHTAAAVLGLSVLLRTSAAAYAAVKYAGAAYLLYLGVAPIGGDDGIDVDGTATAGGFRRGVLVNVFNPKVALFFLAFLPQFVDAGAGSALSMAALGGLYALLTAAYLGSIALLSGRVRAAFRSRPAFETGLQWLSGSVLVALGIRLAVGGRPG